jgi:hypothetical protein
MSELNLKTNKLVTDETNKKETIQSFQSEINKNKKSDANVDCKLSNQMDSNLKSHEINEGAKGKNDFNSKNQIRARDIDETHSEPDLKGFSNKIQNLKNESINHEILGYLIKNPDILKSILKGKTMKNCQQFFGKFKTLLEKLKLKITQIGLKFKIENLDQGSGFKIN